MATLEEALAPILRPSQDTLTSGNQLAAIQAANQIAAAIVRTGATFDPSMLNGIEDPALREAVAAAMPKALKAVEAQAGITTLERLKQARDDALRQIGLTRDAQTGQLNFTKETSLRDLGVNRERLLRDLQFGHTGNLHDLDLLKRQIMDDVAARGLWNSGAKVFEDQEAAYRLGRENEQYGYGVGDANQNYQFGTSDANRGYDLQMAALNAALGNQEFMTNRDYTQGQTQAMADLLGAIGGSAGDYASNVAGNQAAYNQALQGLLAQPPQHILDQVYGTQQPPPPPPPSGPGAVGGTVAAGAGGSVSNGVYYPPNGAPVGTGSPQILNAPPVTAPKPPPKKNPIMLLK